MMVLERWSPVGVPVHDERTGVSGWPVEKNASRTCRDVLHMEVWGDMPRDIQETLFETATLG
jgi:hypothetical protein